MWESKWDKLGNVTIFLLICWRPFIWNNFFSSAHISKSDTSYQSSIMPRLRVFTLVYRYEKKNMDLNNFTNNGQKEPPDANPTVVKYTSCKTGRVFKDQPCLRGWDVRKGCCRTLQGWWTVLASSCTIFSHWSVQYPMAENWIIKKNNLRYVAWGFSTNSIGVTAAADAVGHIIQVDTSRMKFNTNSFNPRFAFALLFTSIISIYLCLPGIIFFFQFSISLWNHRGFQINVHTYLIYIVNDIHTYVRRDPIYCICQPGKNFSRPFNHSNDTYKFWLQQ